MGFTMNIPITSSSGYASPVFSALRDRTRALHHRIDHHPLLAPLVQTGLTLDHYLQVLQTLNWIYQPLEPLLNAAVLRWCGSTGFIPSPRLEWLRRDLELLRGECATHSLPPHRPSVPVPDSAAATIGMLYVVEGSTLGGAVIARQVQNSLGLQADTGAAYFNGNGVATQHRWEMFYSSAVSMCPVDQAELATNAASSLFKVFLNILDVADAHFRSVRL